MAQDRRYARLKHFHATSDIIGLDDHIADSTIHFLEGDISHLNIQDIGTKSHGTIDLHIDDGDIHFTVASLATTYLPLAGGTMVGQIDAQNVIPDSDATYDLGGGTSRWDNFFGGTLDLHQQQLDLGYTITDTPASFQIKSNTIINEVGGGTGYTGTASITVNSQYLTTNPTWQWLPPNTNVISDGGTSDRGAGDSIWNFPNAGNLNHVSKFSNGPTLAGHTTTVANNCFGSTLVGAVGAGLDGAAGDSLTFQVNAPSFFGAGNFVGGFATNILSNSGTPSVIEANWSSFFDGGAFVYGFAKGGTIRGAAAGVFVSGYAQAGGTLTATAGGSMATGYAKDASSAITASAFGSSASGAAILAGTITASGRGATAFGFVRDAGSSVTAQGWGSVALGYCATVGTVLASANGSFAFGNMIAAACSATAVNSAQWFAGVNAEVNSLQVGGGIRLCAAMPTLPKPGDMYVDGAGTVQIFSWLAGGGPNRWVAI